MRIAFHTLGCKLNFAETTTIARELVDRGYEKVAFRETADVYVINTCSVTAKADRECRKVVRQALRRSPGATVALIGCYAQLQPHQVASIPGVSLVLGAGEKFNLAEHLQALPANGQPTVLSGPIDEQEDFIAAFSTNERTRAFLKVQDGCDYGCSFCTIPLARGKSRSPAVVELVGMARDLARGGAREIVLTGVNVGDFGRGRGESFYNLIQSLDAVPGIERYRISSLEPNLLSDEILDFITRSRKFVPHFHLPLQSGLGKILRTMRRRYTRELYAGRVDRIRKHLPQSCIGADVIVGFPGETEADFREGYAFIRDLDISYLHVFTYSEREGTAALKLANPVPPEERARRSRMLRILSDKKRHSFYQRQLNTNREVLFETWQEGRARGHSDNYIPVQVKGPPELVNQIHPVRLEAIRGGIVVGGLIRPLAELDRPPIRRLVDPPAELVPRNGRRT